METRPLGTTGLHISRLGVGAWAIGGGDYAFGWGPQDDRDSVAAIRRAVDLGINWVDTAPVYGLGRSEIVVGRALKEIGAGSRPYVFTKCSLVWDDGDRKVTHSLEAASIRREVEASLTRLDVPVIDLYQIHWPRFAGGESRGTIEEAWTTLAALQREGKVRHIGVSNFKVQDLETAAGIAPVASLQPQYSILRRAIEAEALPYCRAHGIGVIVYSPMQSGLLSGRMTRERVASMPKDDFRRTNPEFQEPRLSRNLAFAALLGGVGRRHGRSAGEVAVAWALRHPAVTGAIVGLRSPAQVEGMIGAAALRLTDEEVAEIEAGVPKS